MRANDDLRLGRAALTAAVLATLVGLGGGCGARDNGLFGPLGEGGAAGSTTTGTAGAGGELPPPIADRVDILLVLDNSRSMADKQQILGLAVPELVGSLVNPLCIDANGVPAAQQPAGPDEPCPGPTKRQFAPVDDFHIGVITTSLGGHGADACSAETEPSENDQGHLISRTTDGGSVPTYQQLGFLAWDPNGKASPPGESDPDVLVKQLTDIVLGAGQLGCGFEATHESWYRFLVEPDPYESVVIEGGDAQLKGTDSVLLQQRKAFLRPDSLVLVVTLSDENDCSLREGGQYYYAAQIYAPGTSNPYHLPKPRAACATDPSSPCCRSCGQAPGDGCSDDKDDCSSPLDVMDDQINVRCWDQKRRFGIDFLYPPDRYVTGLTELEVSDRSGNIVPNPLFVGGKRSGALVFLSAIVGVPWQDIARRSAGGEPDLVKGLDATGHAVGAFMSAAELVANDGWDLVLGSPSAYHTDPAALPDDPLMIETYEPRSGVNPITGDMVAPPGAPVGANSINGHEHSIPQRDDLQYACIFDLGMPRDCADPKEIACDCQDAKNDNPLCQDAATDKFGQIQFRAKAYPGIRHLELIKLLGEQGVLGSICPRHTADTGALDFGYRPTVRTMLEALASRLKK